MKVTRALCGALAAFALTGCDGCRSEKPYTPFGVASSVPVPQSSDAPPMPSASASAAAPTTGFEPKKALLAPPSAAASWRVEELELRAPAGRAFAQALSFDANGDGKNDVLAWTVPAPNSPPTAVPGELWYFDAAGTQAKVLTLPGFVPTGPGCNLDVQLSQTGPRTATLDAAARCEVPLLARAPQRALSVIAPGRERPVVLTLRVAAPAPEETLELAVDSSDQDGDGRDDVRLIVTAGKSGAERASAELSFFDRAAGVSRTASEPAASLGRFASREVVRAKSKKNAPAVLERVDAARRLLASLCAESGTPRIFDEDNNPIRCGNLSTPLDHLASAEQTAALTLSDVTRAASVLARDGWYLQAVSANQRKQLERELGKAVTRRELSSAVTLTARPRAAGKTRLSPLWFESGGELLVQTAAGVMRVSSDGTSETPLDPDAQSPWPLELTSPSGLRLLDVVDSCDRSEIALSVADGAGPKPSLPTTVLAPRPGACTGRGARSRYFAPIGFGDAGLEALIGAVWVKPREPVQPLIGGARSPDGRVVVTPHPLGLLIAGEVRELWTVSALGGELASPERFENCVVANGASAVACVVGGRARLFLKP